VINSSPSHSLLAENLSEKLTEKLKDDKLRGDGLLSRFHNITSTHLMPLTNSNNFTKNSLTGKYKKTDTPMLNLVYDSHFKHRHPDFR
jgi:hypothetical protein